MLNENNTGYDAWNNPLQTLIKEALRKPQGQYWDVARLAQNTANWSKNSLTVLEERYRAQMPGSERKETVSEMYGRIAWTVSGGAHAADDEERLTVALRFWHIMTAQRFLPNSPTQVNAGITGKGGLSACFVVSPEDNLPSIMEVATEAAMIEKSGGGVGFNFSKLRPRKDVIATTHGEACGPIAVMKLYSQVGATLTQGAFRLGAHMATLDIDHPDVREFIHCKDNDDTLQNFNVSVGVSGKFMEAAESNKSWDLINPRNGEVVETVNALELWNEICESAWRTGDPGMIFVDAVAAAAPNPHMGKSWPNPCAEQLLENHGSCNLGSLNLVKYVDGDGAFMWDQFREDIGTAIRFLDAVVEVNEFPLPILQDVNRRTRRIGLGVMGWADLLIKMGVAYDSEEALELADEIAAFMNITAWKESAKMAQETEPYPEWKNSALAANDPTPRRNSCVLSVAPTGTISRIADCSSGIEPHFANAWWSNVLWTDHEGTSQRLLDAPSSVWEGLRDRLKDEDKVREVLGQLADSPEDADRIYAENGIDSSVFRTSMTIVPEAHIRMQAAWQKHFTNGVSKTINLPNNATVGDIARSYILAFETGCKGVTVYRDGSKSMQVLETGKKDSSAKLEQTGQPEALQLGLEPVRDATLKSTPKARPAAMLGITEKVSTGHGTMYVTLNFDENNKPFEVFTAIGKAGGSEPAHLEGLSRLATLCLRSGVDPNAIIHHLSGITSEPVWDNGVLIRSAEDGVAHVLKRHLNGLNSPGA